MNTSTAKPLAVRVLEGRTRARSHKTRCIVVVPRKVYRVHSESEPDTYRTVTIGYRGARCDCPGYALGRSPCRHICAVLRRAEREGWECRVDL